MVKPTGQSARLVGWTASRRLQAGPDHQSVTDKLKKDMASKQNSADPRPGHELIEIDRTGGKLPIQMWAFKDGNSSDNKVTRACLVSLGLAADLPGAVQATATISWKAVKAGWKWRSKFVIVNNCDHEIVLGSDLLDELQLSKNREAFYLILGRRQSRDLEKQLEEKAKESKARNEAERQEASQRRQEKRDKREQGRLAKEGAPRL